MDQAGGEKRSVSETANKKPERGQKDRLRLEE